MGPSSPSDEGSDYDELLHKVRLVDALVPSGRCRSGDDPEPILLGVAVHFPSADVYKSLSDSLNRETKGVGSTQNVGLLKKYGVGPTALMKSINKERRKRTRERIETPPNTQEDENTLDG